MRVQGDHCTFGRVRARGRPRRSATVALSLLLIVTAVLAPTAATAPASAALPNPSPAPYLLTSRLLDNVTGPGASRHGVISGNGAVFAYTSENDQWGTDGYVAGTHLYVDGPSGLAMVVDPQLTSIADPADVVISEDGHFVAFTARRLVNDPTSGRAVYTVDLSTRRVSRVESDPTLLSGSPSISDDGRYVAYDVAPVATPSARQVRVWDRRTTKSRVVSQVGPTLGNHPSRRPAISGDGTQIAFTTEATNLVSGMALQPRHGAGGSEAVVADRVSGTITLLSNTGGAAATAPTGNSWISGPQALSTDGSWAVFATDAVVSLFDTSVTGDANGAADLVRRDRSSGVARTISRIGDVTCDGASTAAAVDDNGGVAFASTCTDLTGAPFAPGADVYQGDGTAPVTLVSHVGDTTAPARDLDVTLLEPSVTTDGATVVWSTARAVNLDFQTDENDNADVYRAATAVGGVDVDGSEVPATDPRDACPDRTRSAVVAVPPPGDGVDVRDLSLSVAYHLGFANGQVSLEPLPLSEDPGNNTFTDPPRAMVLEMPDAGGGTRFVVWDAGGGLLFEVSDVIPGAAPTDRPVAVALCMPALATYGPKAFPDLSSARTGATVNLDVLANDEGDLDRSSLSIGTVSGGSAAIQLVDDLPVIAYQAPATAGPQTIQYSVTDFFGTTTSALATVNVAPIATSPLTLNATEPNVAPGADVAVTLTATNATGAPVDGALVSLRVEAPATIAAGGAGWTCTVTGDQRGATCTNPVTVATGDTFAALPLTVRTPAGPQQPCDPAAPGGTACVVLHAWNGDGVSEGAASPAPIRADLPYTGGVLRATFGASGPFSTGSLATYPLTLANAGGAPLPQGTLFEITSGQVDMPFVSGSSTRVSCAADVADPARGICTTTNPIAAGDTEALSVLFTTGAGHASGCPSGVTAPCALADVAWIDQAAATLRVPLAALATSVGGPANPVPPDAAVQLTHPAAAWSGQETNFGINVGNAGIGPTTDPITASLTLPAGITPTSVSAPGWTCTLTPTTQCTRTTPLAAGSLAEAITVVADVAPGATGGVATATVSTAGDASPANNTMSATLVVLDGDLDDPDGPAHVVIDVDSPLSISPGATIGATARLRNLGSTPVDGPTTIAVLLPDGLPAGQVLSAAARPSTWQCITTALLQARELRCTTTAGIPAGGATEPLPLDITGTSLATGSTVDVTFTHALDGVPAASLLRLTVTAPRVTNLALATHQEVALRPAGEATLTISGTNVGNAAPIEDLQAHVVLPTGVTLGEASGAGWTCGPTGTATVDCTNPARPLPGTVMPSLALRLVAADTAAIGSPITSIVVSTRDETAPRTFSQSVRIPIVSLDAGELTVKRTGLAGTTGPDRTLDYQLTASNAGRVPVSGTLSVTETLPAGSIVSGIGTPWNCTTVGTTLTCTAINTTLAVGAAAPPLRVQATLPAGLGGGQAQLSAVVSLGPATGMAADAVAVAASVIPRADPRTRVAGQPAVLVRGSTGTATVQLANRGTAALDGPVVAGLVLSRGLLPTAASGDGWTCRIDGHGSRGAVACSRPGAAAAGETLPTITVAFDVASSAGDHAVFDAGLVTGAAASDLPSALAGLTGMGAAALSFAANDVRPVRGLVAHAGPDQTVPERTPSGDGTVATVVRLDGRGSSAGSAGLHWSWTQTEGPAVQWSGPTTPVVGTDGTTHPAIAGATPSFTVPRLADSSSVQLRFELTATSGDASQTDTVDVLVTPTPDAGPRLGKITTDLPEIATAPAAATTVRVATTVADPEGDPVSVQWRIGSTDGSLATATIVGDDHVVTTPGDASHATFSWPDHASYVVVEATGTSRRGGVSTTTLVIGTAPPPPSISVQAPAEVASGSGVSAVASLDVGDATSTIWRWRQLSGPAIDPAVLDAANGPTLTFTAPSVATAGEVLVLQAVATRVAGTASAAAPASVSIRITPLAAPAIAISGARSVAASTPLDLTATGAPAGSTIRWVQTAGAAGSFSTTSGSATTFQSGSDGVAGIQVTVEDPTGRVTSATAEITVGTPFTPNASAACGAAGSLFDAAVQQAAAGGLLSATVGPVSLSLGNLRVEAPCGGAQPALSFSDATFSVAGGAVTGSGLAGRVSPSSVCLTGGTLRFPESWGISSAELGSASPICVSLAAGAANPITGSVTVTGLPFIKMPTGMAPPVTTIDFTGSTISVSTDAALPDGGTLTLSVAVDVRTGHFTGAANGRVVILGTPVLFTGAVSYDGTTFDFSLDGSVPGPVPIVAGTTLSDLTLHVGRDGFAFGGTVSVEGKVTLTAAGSFSDASHWSLSLAGTTGQPDWSPLPGFTLPPVGFNGLVRRDGGPVEFDVAVGVPGEWNPVAGLRVTSLEARLSNLEPPADCPSVPAGSVWLAVAGSATVSFDASSVTVDGKACVAPGQSAWSFSSSATLDSFKPVPSLDVSIESLGISAIDRGAASGVEVMAYGSARAFGASLAAVMTVKNGSVVVDASGSLSDLGTGAGLPSGATGHVLFASKDRPGYRFYRAGAIPTVDPDLAAVTVSQGVSLYASITLGTDIRNVITNQLGLPDVSAVVVSVQLGAGPPVLKASISFGDPGQGYTLYEDCGGVACTEATRTRLALHAITLTLSATGAFGFAAEARLDLAASDQTPASSLGMTASVTIDLPKSKITMALFTSDGTWHGALGTPGLDLADLAVQAGVDFAQPIPTPSVGFAATINRIPDDWASTIGIDPDDQEPMHFGLNLSTSSPIIDLQIGEADGHTAIDPLAPLGAAGILEIDYASLVVAPFGGTLGAKVYAPGISVGFAATIAGVDLDAAFSVNMAASSVVGEVHVGPLSIGGFNVNNVDVSFALQPLQIAEPFSMRIAGDFVLPSFGSGVPGTAQGALEVTIHDDGLEGALEIHAANVGLARIASLDTLDLSASLAVTRDRPLDFAVDATATATIFGAHVGAAGSLKIESGRLTELSLQLSVDATIGSLALSGPGCGGALGDHGACVSFTKEKGWVSASLVATIEVGGFAVAIDAEVNSNYLRGSGSLTVPGVGSFALEGAVYTGSDSSLGGIRENDLEGNSQQVRQGDFRLSSSYSSADLGGFTGAASASVVHIGSSNGVQLAGWVSVAGGFVQGKGSFTLNGSQLVFDFAASGGLTIDGFRLATVDVHFARTAGGFSATVAASIDLGLGGVGARAAVNGSFSLGAGGQLRYAFTGSVDFVAAGMSLHATVDFSNARFGFAFDLGAASLFDVHLSGQFSAGGYFAVSTTFDGPGFSAGIEVSKSPSGWSFRAQIAWNGYTLAWASFSGNSFTAGVDLSVYRSGSKTILAVRVGGTFSGSMHLSVTVTKTGGSYAISGSFSGALSVSGWVQFYGCSNWCTEWGWGSPESLGTWGVAVKPDGSVCATLYGKELCV